MPRATCAYLHMWIRCCNLISFYLYYLVVQTCAIDVVSRACPNSDLNNLTQTGNSMGSDGLRIFGQDY